MDELFALVYFLIALNMCVILFMGYKECNNTNVNLSSLNKVESDNIFTRRS